MSALALLGSLLRRRLFGKWRHAPLRNPQRRGTRGAQLVRSRMAHVRTTRRGKGPIKTMACELVFTPKMGCFTMKFKGLG
jgi:hypothetical protein